MAIFDLADVIRRTAASVRAAMPPGSRLEVDCPEHLWAVGDVDLVARVVLAVSEWQMGFLTSSHALWLSASADEEAGLASVVIESSGSAIADDEWETGWLPALRGGAVSGSPIAGMLEIDALRAAGAEVSAGSGDAGTTIVLSFQVAKRDGSADPTATQIAKRGGSADPTATQIAKRGGSADPTAIPTGPEA